MYTSERVQEINRRVGAKPPSAERQASWERLFGNGRKTLIITLTPQPRMHNPSAPAKPTSSTPEPTDQQR